MPKKIKEAKKVKNEDKEKQVKLPAKEIPTTDAEIKKNLITHAEQMKDWLDKQPQVMIMIPLEKGEKKGTEQPFCLNGYHFTVPKGKMVSVAEQVAGMIQERFEVELEIRAMSLGQQPKATQDALA